MTTTATLPAAPATRTRIAGLDRARGLAIVLMVADHCCVFIPGGFGYRITLGRLAMPIFFVLAGYLARRITSRHLYVVCIGAALPLAVPWIDNPNVLVWWALGCVLLYAMRCWGLSPWLLIIACAGYAANGWPTTFGDTYSPLGLFALLAVGQLLPATAWRWTDRLPRWLALPGRHPIALYVGHLLVLELIVTAVGALPAH